MPTVLRVGGFRFGFYPDDHEPPHVHVSYAGAVVVVEIETGVVRDIMGMKKPDVAESIRIVAAHRGELLAAWIEKRSATERRNG